MSDAPGQKPPRVLLSSFPSQYGLPAKPSRASDAVLDAYRQTSFLLGDELALFERAINVQLGLVAANAKIRGPRAAATCSLWSRAFANLTDACQLMSGGSYTSCPPLLRAALDAIAAQRLLVIGGFREYEEWFASAISQGRELAALQVHLGHFKAASALVSDQRLGDVYRLLMDLSLPHLGASLLLAAPEASLQKLALGFADNSFHLGWAQLVSGWLVLFAAEQLGVALDSGVFAVDGTLTAEIDTTCQQVERMLSDARRCYVAFEPGRYVFNNFRRSPSGQPKRVVLAS